MILKLEAGCRHYDVRRGISPTTPFRIRGSCFGGTILCRTCLVRSRDLSEKVESTEIISQGDCKEMA